VVKATDEGQNLVWDAQRKPFGQRVVSTELVEMPLGFPGQYYDQETGNYYNYFRDYDPTTGRYLQSDPIGLEGGINTYRYANDNPLIYFDPDGQNVVVIVKGAIIAGSAAIRYCMKHPNNPQCKKAINECQDLARKAKEWWKRNNRRDQQERGPGHRNRSEANKGPRGDRPKGPDRRHNREKVKVLKKNILLKSQVDKEVGINLTDTWFF
jgi:RHS repeat-associated protein